ncbi:MAG: SpoIIE family protein phosphatase, partial [Bdellovibrionota bacterium]
MIQSLGDDGTVILGLHTFDANAESVDTIIALKIPPEVLEAGPDIEIHLAGSNGTMIASATSLDIPALTGEELQPLIEASTQSKTKEGVFEWSRGITRQDEWDSIAGFKRLPNDLVVLSLIPKSTVYQAATEMVRGILALGGIILAISVAMTAFFSRSITRRLQELWAATFRIRNGEFDVEVQGATKGWRDEVSELASAFDAMTKRIKALLKETAQKARMEKELETAQLVQERFFPQTDFDDSRMSLAGHAVPATECAGDWWHYRQIGDQMIVVIGDVTGHGVSAALITAAAHSAFAALMEELAKTPTQAISAALIVERLNVGIFATCGGSSSMSFQASVIDLIEGKLSFINAEHRPAYIFRQSTDENGQGKWKQTAIQLPLVPSLGLQPSLVAKAENY